MAHPLNRPASTRARGVVGEGYGILQPRVGVSLPSAGRSWFARLFAGEPASTPTRARSPTSTRICSSEGSFIGKGIYDVDAFERALAAASRRTPILSHDLLEALLRPLRRWSATSNSTRNTRPATTWTCSRRHRWIRGDWQIAQWLLAAGARRATGRRIANPLSALSRWKIFDNLRRSLVPLALLAAAGRRLACCRSSAGWRPLLVLAVIALPDAAGGPAAMSCASPPNCLVACICAA